MTSIAITVQAGEAPEVESFLAERIYEYNSKATGYFDGESFSATQLDDAGEIQAGIFGFTCGGCCFISYLWVSEEQRHRGAGSALLKAAEQYAATKGCGNILLSSHSFQAPGFYERTGYQRQVVLQDYPLGHADIFFAKRLNGGKKAGAVDNSAR